MNEPQKVAEPTPPKSADSAPPLAAAADTPAQAGTSAAADSPSESATMAITPATAPRPGFWKRLGARRSVRRAHAIVDSAAGEDALLVKLDALEEKVDRFGEKLGGLEQQARANESTVGAWVKSLEEKVTASETTVATRIDALEQQFTRVWEVEEQLGQIEPMRTNLEKLREGQQALETSVRNQGRTLGFATFLLVVTAAAGVVLVLEEAGLIDF